MFDFNVLKFFDINTNGVARGSPGLAVCGGIFCGNMREFIGDFSAFLDIQIASIVEFYGCIRAIEEAQEMGLTSLWVGCDFALICAAFTVRTNVPWIIRNRWNIYLNYYGKIRFRISHIFQEGIACANTLAKLGFIHREQFH
ncbi:uncharacterized protein [Phaseolus vulgaris]|uniref:uncharacterized protein n=1 Tax=Phaseolus vulgaris TaxID=3885 RepID=UPI0035CBED0D